MRKLLAFGFVLSLLLSACKPLSGDTGAIKIGFIGPLTGGAAAYGADTLHGTKMKIKEVNEAGGTNGRQVELIVEDSRCTGADAAAAVQKLVNVDGVVAIIGGACSGETLAAAPIVEAGQVILMSPTSSSSDVTHAGDFVFRNYPSDALKTKAMKQYFADNDLQTVALIAENTDFAVAFRDSLLNEIGEDAIVFNEVVEPDTKDFRTLMARLQDVEFDVFFPDSQSVPVMAAMMQQLREQGLQQPAVSHDVADSIDLINLAGDAVEGMHIINVPNSGEGGEFSESFVAQYGDPQQGMAFVAHAYDAAGVVLQAMQVVGTEGAAMRDYLYALEAYDGIVGTFNFDQNGDVVGVPYALKEIREGAIVEVEDIEVN